MRGMLTPAVLAASLVGAGAAHAAQVATFGRSDTQPKVSRGLNVIGSGTISLSLAGATTNTDYGPARVLPTSITVTDAAGPLEGVSSDCVLLAANSARCTAADGFDLVDANGPSAVDVSPASTGTLTPIDYEVITTDGSDTVSIPASSSATVETLGGNDTITVGNTQPQSGYTEIDAGPGDDQVTAYGLTGGVDCGDGTDSATALFVTPVGVRNCETETTLPTG